MKPMNRPDSKKDRLGTVLLIPLDGRPVCYDLPVLMAKMAGINLLCPPRELLGGSDGVIKSPANVNAMMAWLTEQLTQKRTQQASENISNAINVIVAVDRVIARLQEVNILRRIYYRPFIPSSVYVCMPFCLYML
jgi:hypothetical protein